MKASRLAWLLATVGGVGKVPVIPGLMGTLVGAAIAYGLREATAWSLGLILLGLGAACWAIPQIEAALGQADPSRIVIDETLGILVAYWAVPWYWPAMLAGFVMFRVLDVMKPWGLRRLERLPSPHGVLWDDLACGLLVNLWLQVWVRGFVEKSVV